MSWSGIALLIMIILAIISISIINHIKNKKLKRKKPIFSTKDLIRVILNMGFIVGGLVTLLIGLGYSDVLFGPEVKLAQPLINILAGVLFTWFGIKFLFWGKLD